MAELEPVGHQLVIVTSVFGLLALLTLSVRIGFRIRSRKYDVSDTCLIAAMVRVFQFLTWVLLTNNKDLQHHPERNSNYSGRGIRIWQSESRHRRQLKDFIMARKIGLHQPGGLQAYDTSMQAVTLLAVSKHVLHVDRSPYPDNQTCHPRHHLPYPRSIFLGFLSQHLPVYSCQ